ncbi:MAG: RHS repeat protein, partial [Rubrivivax sp.]
MPTMAAVLRGRLASATARPARRVLALLALLLPLGAAQFSATPAFSCTAPGGGEPSCGGSGPASVGGGGSGSVMVGGGNPINLLSGNKYQEETDLPALPGVLGLEIKRYYNSESSYPGLAGAQWRTSYETVLYDLGNQVQIVQADGRRITLQRGAGAKAQLCTSPQPQDGQVRIEEQGRERVFHWRWADGRVLSFRSLGPGGSSGYPLHGIEAATGERTQLAYNPLGDLIRVTDPQGRQLVFSYGRAAPGQRALLQSVTTPLGRIGYRHDDMGRLTEVAYSKGDAAAPYRTRLYHYEGEYNAGNAFALTGISDRVAVAAGQASVQRLSTYAYDVRGRAILSTKGRPLQPGKAGTGIGQIALQYLQAPSPNEGVADKNGEVQPRPQGLGKVLLTNSLGQTSTLLTAVIGGQLRLIEFTGAGCSSCGPANRRYAYDSTGRLLRTIALDDRGRPVRAQLQRYDAAGRIAQVSEQAYRDGVASGSPQLLRRYAYADAAVGIQPALVTERSVIAGKERSTRLEYNEFGQVTRLIQAGWSPVDAQGAVVAQGIPVSRTTDYRYTVTGGHSVLAEIDGRAVARNAAATDAAASAVAAVLHTPDPLAAATDSVAQDDMATRQRSWQDADGTAFLRATWGDAGTAAEGLVVAWEAGGLRAERRFDDLQRLVGVRNPGEGWRTAVYDAAGRLALTRDPRGATQRLQHDADGQLLKLEQWEAGAASAAAVTEWRRDASGLREVSLRDADGSRRTLLDRDPQGRVIAETLRIEPAGPLAGAMPAAITLTLRYERGADGRIESRTLLDQAGRISRWTQGYDEHHGLVSRLDTRGSAPVWLGGSRPLLSQIEWAAPARAEFASRLVHGVGSVGKAKRSSVPSPCTRRLANSALAGA